MTTGTTLAPRTRDTRLLVLAAGLVLASAVTVLALAVPADVRPVTIVLGAITAVVLFAHLITNGPSEVTPMIAIAGISLVLAGLGLNLVALAAVATLLLTFAELAAIRVILARIPKDAELDTGGRLREAAATVLLGALVAALAALGSLVEVSGQIVAVLLGAVAIGVLGKVIATSARA